MSVDDSIPDDVIDECKAWALEGNIGRIKREYPEQAERILLIVTGLYGRPSYALARNIDEEWYETSDEHEYWHNYNSLLEQKGGGWEEGRKTIDTSTNRILNFFYDPKTESDSDSPEKTQKYGLVVGYVQSGKTANYTGLIAKAADSGYDLVMVLAGTNNDLRRQTQRRLDKELTGHIQDSDGNSVPIPEREWIRITEDDKTGFPGSGDFGGQKIASRWTGIPPLVIFDTNRPIIGVMKKQIDRLAALKKWLGNMDTEKRNRINLLLIDDESDSASADISKARDGDSSTDADEKKASATNALIREILGLFPRRSYVGYTATPYASVLTSPVNDDSGLGPTLYPRNFIISLPPTTGYYGVAEFFDAEGPLKKQVRIPHKDECKEVSNPEIPPNWMPVNDFSTDIPESLKQAIQAFFLAAAARRCRGQESEINTMVLHNSMGNDNQEFIWKRVTNYTMEIREQFLDEFSDEGTKLRQQLEALWNDDFRMNENTEEEWDAIKEEFEVALSSFHPENDVYLVNSDDDDQETTVVPTERQLDYNDYPDGGCVIAVGGNILSRGLTLEGLCVSYFVRETKIYDSLTQMGRWFGFRPGYSDLVRLYLSPNLLEWFVWLVEVESDLRADIERYDKEDKGPLELAVRVLKHVRSAPGEVQLTPTRDLAMQSAEEWSGGLDGMTPMTKHFHLDDVSVLRRNLERTSDFFAELSELSSPVLLEKGAKKSYLWKKIDYNIVIEYILGQEFPQLGSWKTIEIIPYIRERVEGEEARKWSVCFVNNSIGTPQTIPGSGNQDTGFSIAPNTRSRLRGKESIEELTTSSHLGIDMNGYPSEYTGLEGRAQAKSDRHPDSPLLLIYILDKESAPDPNGLYTEPHDPLFEGYAHKEHVVGLCTVFPYSESAEDDDLRTYYHARGVDPVNTDN